MPRGRATVSSVTSYVGKPFRVWRGGAWRPAYGWQRLRRHRYPPEIGSRWLADFDIPDLELFPDRYPGVHTVEFGAGLELTTLHLGLWLLSWPSRWGWTRALPAHADRLRSTADWLAEYGTDCGAMHVSMDGYRRGHRLTVTWTLVANGGDGPQVACTAAVVLARKLAAGTLVARGALPCVGLFSLEECMKALADFDVRATTERGPGLEQVPRVPVRATRTSTTASAAVPSRRRCRGTSARGCCASRRRAASGRASR